MRVLEVCVAFLVLLGTINVADSSEKKVIKNFYDYVNGPALEGMLDRANELTTVSLWRSDIYYQVAFEKEKLDLKAKFRETIKRELDKIDKIIDVDINYREDNPNFYFVGLNDFFNPKFSYIHNYMKSISSRDMVRKIKTLFSAGYPCAIIVNGKPSPIKDGSYSREIVLSFIAMNMDADYEDVVKCSLVRVLNSFGIRSWDGFDYYFSIDIDTIFNNDPPDEFGADDLAVIEFLYYSDGIVSGRKLNDFLNRSVR